MGSRNILFVEKLAKKLAKSDIPIAVKFNLKFTFFLNKAGSIRVTQEDVQMLEKSVPLKKVIHVK